MQPGTKREDSDREFTFRDEDFDFLARFVHSRIGIVLDKSKREMVYGRLARRLRRLELDSFKEYCELLKGDQGDAEIGNLVNAITTNMTSFFRENHHFEHLCDQVAAHWLTHPPAGRRLRIWSAGSSTGAEAYTIAMVLSEALKTPEAWDLKILATDIDTNVLDTGRAGIYAGDAMEKIPARYKKYVQQEGDKIVIGKVLRDLVHFKPLNLLEPWPMKGPFDVIFCRNVLIYFDKSTQRSLFDRYADVLKPEGWLYIGHSESMHNLSTRFKLEGKTIYRRVR